MSSPIKLEQLIREDERHYNETMAWIIDNLDVIYPMTKGKL